MSEVRKRKIINGELCIYCEKLGEWLPKFKTENEIIWELDEKYFVYFPEGYTIEAESDTDLICEELFKYNLSVFYGLAREAYLENEKYDLYLELRNSCCLRRHLVELDIKARKMEKSLVEHIAKIEGVNNELKEKNQGEWVEKMNCIIYRVREIVQNELIYV